MTRIHEIREEQVLVIGGTGSLGVSLMKKLSALNKVTLFSRDEAKHWTIRNENLSVNRQVDFIVGDIRDRSRIYQAIKESQPSVIILAAALKQVDTCEIAPSESIKTNILGIQNVIDVVLEMNSPTIKTVCLVSTDKACAPTNVYGMSKAIAERLVVSASLSSSSTKFVAVRYGNVLESRGSIIPLYRYQSENTKLLTVTNEEMTRFVMTLSESIALIEATVTRANTGETWLPKLKSMKIMDLAEIFAKRTGSSVEITGIRPGEKLHEELVSEPESVRVQFLDEFMVMKPSFADFDSGRTFGYSSKDYLLNLSELESYLLSIGIFETPLSNFPGRKIEEIRTTER